MSMFVLAIEKSWTLTLFRGLFAFLDYLIYKVISLLFKTMFQLSNFELAGFYEPIQQRVYVILGIFMLFKVTVSLISYLVNPDKISDKEQGVGKVVTRIITVLVMLIMLPNAFSLMTELQNKLLPVIPRIIVGTNISETTAISNAEGVGELMSSTLIQSFASHDDCSTATDLNNLDTFLANINEGCSTNSSIYAYNYIPVLSTIVGLLMCYVVVSLCISVAIRAFKLIILRMLAPIPVISYIDPKSSKDGMFATWTKTFLATWAELFVYIGLIYFIIYMIGFLLTGDAWRGFFNGVDITNNIETGLFLAFIFIGLLFFARQAPKFIFDALGIKTKGNFVRMLGMGAAAVGMGGSTAASLRARNEYDKEQGNDPHLLRNFGASLFSGLASGEAAGHALISTDKPTLTTGVDAQGRYNATNLSRISSGSTFGGRLMSRGQSLILGENDYERDTKVKEANEAANKALLQYKNTMEKKALEKNYLYVDLDSNHKKINYLEFMAHSDGAKNGDADSLQWFIDHGFAKTVTVNEEIEEEYQHKIGTENVWNDDLGEYVPVDKFETRTRTVSKPVTKTIADWQDAQLYLDKIKDLQTQKHASQMVDIINLADKGDTNAQDILFSDYGTEYNDYRLAKDSTTGLNMNVDFSRYATSDDGTYGIKQALGETNKRVTNIVTKESYKAAKSNADAIKNNRSK